MSPLLQILLAVIAVIGNAGWFLDGRKHRAQTRAINTDTDLKDFDLAQRYVEQFQSQIADPLRAQAAQLQHQVDSLKNEINHLSDTINQLNHAIQKIKDCPYSAADSCPVLNALQHPALLPLPFCLNNNDSQHLSLPKPNRHLSPPPNPTA